MKTKGLIIYSLLLVSATICVDELYERSKVHHLPTSTEAAWLSPDELNRLKERVSKEKDADAAFKIAMYFQRNKGDIQSATLWHRKAAMLGNSYSQAWLSSHSVLTEDRSNSPSPAVTP